jgi:hypothetical protein
MTQNKAEKGVLERVQIVICTCEQAL